MDGNRRELARQRAWEGWAEDVSRCLTIVGKAVPAGAATSLAEAAALEIPVDLDDIDPLTLNTLADNLASHLRKGLPAAVAVVSSADTDYRLYQHAFDAAAWCRYQQAAGVDLQEMATLDTQPDLLEPVSRLPVTYVQILLWNRDHQMFWTLFDRTRTPAGSAAAQVAGAVMEVAVNPDAAASWAALGLTLSSSPVSFFPPPPKMPPPRDMAAALQVLAAKYGDLTLSNRCAAVWQPSDIDDVATLWTNWLEDRPGLSEDSDGEDGAAASAQGCRATKLAELAELTCRALGARPRVSGAIFTKNRSFSRP